MEEKWETLKLEKSVLSEWEAQRGTADRETGRGCNLGMFASFSQLGQDFSTNWRSQHRSVRTLDGGKVSLCC